MPCRINLSSVMPCRAILSCVMHNVPAGPCCCAVLRRRSVQAAGPVALCRVPPLPHAGGGLGGARLRRGPPCVQHLRGAGVGICDCAHLFVYSTYVQQGGIFLSTYACIFVWRERKFFLVILPSCLPVHPPIHLSTILTVGPSIRPLLAWVPDRLPACLPTCPPVCLHVLLTVCLPCLPAHPPTLPALLTACLPGCRTLWT